VSKNLLQEPARREIAWRRLTATVFQGDMTLHNVEVAPPDKSGKQKSK
jgi:hypothetical protein